MPVLKRNVCHEWVEAYPDSEGARHLYDDGTDLWVVGMFPYIVRGHDDTWNSIPLPGDMAAGTFIHRAKNGRLFVVGFESLEYDKQVVHLYATENIDDPEPDWLDIPTEDGYCETMRLFVVENDERIFVIAGRKYDSLLAYGWSLVYELQEGIIEHKSHKSKMEELKYRGLLEKKIYYKSVGGHTLLLGKHGVDVWDPDTGSRRNIVPTQEMGKSGDNYVFGDAIRDNNGVWIVSSSSQILEYNETDGKMRCYAVGGASPGDNGLVMESIRTDLRLLGKLLYLPTIEVLFGTDGG